MRAVVALSIALSACASCNAVGPDEGPYPPCTSGYHRGQTLRVVLDSVYDPSSDFLYEDRFGSQSRDSCNAVDGLAPGKEVAFGPLALMDPTRLSGSGCAPYGGSFAPEPLQYGVPYVAATSDVRRLSGISIAASIAEGYLSAVSVPVVVVRELMTPTGDPDGGRIDRQLPPLVLVRTIPTMRCGDAWVARWSPSP
jgi:hypothetical protein